MNKRTQKSSAAARKRRLRVLLILLPMLCGLLLRLLYPVGGQRLQELLTGNGELDRSVAAFFTQSSEALPVWAGDHAR